jgi:hypothetical protein
LVKPSLSSCDAYALAGASVGTDPHRHSSDSGRVEVLATVDGCGRCHLEAAQPRGILVEKNQGELGEGHRDVEEIAYEDRMRAPAEGPAFPVALWCVECAHLELSSSERS